MAGACSMAVGEFVSVATQRDIELALNQEYPSKENSNLQEIKLEIPKNEKTIIETYILTIPSGKISAGEGGTDGSSRKDRDEKERLPNPFKAGVASASAFLCGSLFPLVSAMAVDDYATRVMAVVVAASVALVLFGGIGAFVGGSCVRASAVRVLVGGWISMAVTYSLLKPIGCCY
ncbi:hypothetical protein L6452_05277 [Arctium lappa]|uniref:Uncharacterized protein n=1 Tax=Arctium lappa TaxID=4217 RepID=A0ACB9EFI6_ARCLA|nr:hypothetical protein L6452_05277 [Arctium lappa]